MPTTIRALPLCAALIMALSACVVAPPPSPTISPVIETKPPSSHPAKRKPKRPMMTEREKKEIYLKLLQMQLKQQRETRERLGLE